LAEDPPRLIKAQHRPFRVHQSMAIGAKGDYPRKHRMSKVLLAFV